MIIKLIALLISSKSGPIPSGVPFFWVSKSFFVCLFPCNVGPGPIAHTLIRGLNAWANDLVRYHNEFFETEYAIKLGL